MKMISNSFCDFFPLSLLHQRICYWRSIVKHVSSVVDFIIYTLYNELRWFFQYAFITHDKFYRIQVKNVNEVYNAFHRGIEFFIAIVSKRESCFNYSQIGEQWESKLKYTFATNRDKGQEERSVVVKRKCRRGCRLRSIQLADTRETSGCFETRECLPVSWSIFVDRCGASRLWYKRECNNSFQDYSSSIYRPCFILYFR